MNNNYNNYNSNGSAYEERSNNKEEESTYEYGAGTNTTHEYCTNYPPTPATDNTPSNYEQKTTYNDAVDKIPGMGAAEEKAILGAIENEINASTIDTTV